MPSYPPVLLEQILNLPDGQILHHHAMSAFQYQELADLVGRFEELGVISDVIQVPTITDLDHALWCTREVLVQARNLEETLTSMRKVIAEEEIHQVDTLAGIEEVN